MAQENKDSKFEELRERVSEIPINEPLLDVNQMGEGLRLIDSKPFRLDSKSAEKILELPTFVGERPVRDGHVEYLMGAMERGTFLPELVQLATCSLAGKDYRINGQHTCWAIWKLSQEGKKREFNVRHFRYLAKTDEDLRRLYSSFDRNAPRTPYNILRSYLSGTPGFDKYSDKVIKLASEGLAMCLWEKEISARYDMDDRVYLMQNDHKALVFKVMDLLSSIDLTKSAKHLRRQAIAAAMYSTFRVPQKDKPATEFWFRVADGLDLTRMADPRYRLREFLTGVTMKSGERNLLNRRVVGSEYIYRACIYCWNAWRRGEEQKSIIVPTSVARPKAI